MKFYPNLEESFFKEHYLRGKEPQTRIFSGFEFKVEQLSNVLEELYDEKLCNIVTDDKLKKIKKQLSNCDSKVWSKINTKLKDPDNNFISEVYSRSNFLQSQIYELLSMQTSEQERCLVTYLIGKDLLNESKKTMELSINNVNDLKIWLSVYTHELSWFDAMYIDLFDRLNWSKNSDISAKIASEYFSERNSKAANKRHEPSRRTMNYAISRFKETEPQKSIKQSVRSFYQEVISFGQSVGFTFTDEIQAFDTIYKWILKFNKSEK